ncbi:AraC family transcriptional regulator [Noviherbaspirillum massiliense]|uniref:AraC family transcriptional regulator n=1 Tax=Noviherbaspirillum massiliense TaxID=1465823 RepID=UPI00031817DF|nr:AraC family transcriptional regulator [Noviherbaspirillum massiliense]
MDRAFPGIDDCIDPPYKMAVLIDILAEEGIPASAVLAGSGVGPDEVRVPATRISARQLLTVCANAQRLSKDPGIAIKAGRRIHITHFGLYGYALLSSPTPREAIEFAIRYRPLAAPLIGLRFREDGGDPAWEFEDSLGLGIRSELFRFVLEFQLGTQLSLHGDILGKPVTPLEIRIAYPAPPNAAVYEELLGCPVRFGQPGNELRLSRALLRQELAYANPITAALVRETCDRLLAELKMSAGIAGKVSAMLMAQPGRFPGIEAVADALGMTSRTLRRKLQAQDTSYQALLTDVRKQLAIDYLRKTRMNTEDIAAALGFSDAANFRHAFKKWTGKTPSDFRPAAG